MVVFVVIFAVLCVACIVAYIADDWAEKEYRKELDERSKDDGSDRYDR